jgi:hypothetical protein
MFAPPFLSPICWKKVSVRPSAAGRKNWLFAGSPRGARAAATFLTVIDSARRAGLNTWDYLRDLIARITDHPVDRLEELLPNNWQAPGQTA